MFIEAKCFGQTSLQPSAEVYGKKGVEESFLLL